MVFLTCRKLPQGDNFRKPENKLKIIVDKFRRPDSITPRRRNHPDAKQRQIFQFMLDPNEAPEGFLAEQEQARASCYGCYFHREHPLRCTYLSIMDEIEKCHKSDRNDKTSVIFKKKP